MKRKLAEEDGHVLRPNVVAHHPPAVEVGVVDERDHVAGGHLDRPIDRRIGQALDSAALAADRGRG